MRSTTTGARVRRIAVAPAAKALCAVACVLAMAAAACAPQEAFAQDAPDIDTSAAPAAQKNAIPALHKEVSVDSGPYGDSVWVPPGGHVHYRITATMPQEVEELQMLAYTVRDTPDADITLDLRSATAWIRAADGTRKAELSPTATLVGKTASIRLGDLREACPGLAFGDECIVEYDASLSKAARPGKHPNVAWLRFDRGSGIEETEKAMAEVLVDAPETEAPQAPGKPLPATGDQLPAAVAAVAGIAGIVALAARRRLAHP